MSTTTKQHPKVEIAVKNFGPIREADIELRPLTVFVGENNTGKTHLSRLIYALHGVFDGFRRHEHIDPFDYVIEPKIELSLNSIIANELKRNFNLESVSALRRDTGERYHDATLGIKTSEKRKVSTQEGAWEEFHDIWSMEARINDTELVFDQATHADRVAIAGVQAVEENWPVTHHLHYLPAHRGGIMQNYRVVVSSLIKRTTRLNAEHAAGFATMSGVMSDFMQRIMLYKENTKPNDVLRDIAEALESDVLAGEIRVHPSPSGYPDFYYHPQGMRSEMCLSQASSMVSELAPLVLFIRGFVAPGDTLIIEEPEAQLSPEAQVEIVSTLGRLVRAGVRVVVTTHSDWVLKQIGNLIRAGLITEKGEVCDRSGKAERWLLPDEVGVWQFHTSGVWQFHTSDEPVEFIPFTNPLGVTSDVHDQAMLDTYNRAAGLHNRLVGLCEEEEDAGS